MVVSMLTRCGLVHAAFNLQAAHMNVQHFLILVFIHNKLELDPNVTKAILRMYYTKEEVMMGNKLLSGCKNLDDQTRTVGQNHRVRSRALSHPDKSSKSFSKTEGRTRHIRMCYSHHHIAESAGAVEYIDCTSTEV